MPSPKKTTDISLAGIAEGKATGTAGKKKKNGYTGTVKLDFIKSLLARPEGIPQREPKTGLTRQDFLEGVTIEGDRGGTVEEVVGENAPQGPRLDSIPAGNPRRSKAKKR